MCTVSSHVLYFPVSNKFLTIAFVRWLQYSAYVLVRNGIVNEFHKVTTLTTTTFTEYILYGIPLLLAKLNGRGSKSITWIGRSRGYSDEGAHTNSKRALLLIYTLDYSKRQTIARRKYTEALQLLLVKLHGLTDFYLLENISVPVVRLHCTILNFKKQGINILNY